MRVPLSRAYEAHGRKVDAIEVREPTGSQLLVWGEPTELIFSREGTPVVVENREAIRAYLEACCDPGPEVLAQLGVADYRAVKAALIGFFVRPEGASTASSTPSSSGSDAA
jgi:hypothetical protein